MNIQIDFKKRKKQPWKVVLTAGILFSLSQNALAQERVYPPEPQPPGIRLTPLDKIYELQKEGKEADVMLAVAGSKAGSAQKAVQTSKTKSANTSNQTLAPLQIQTPFTGEPTNNAPASDRSAPFGKADQTPGPTVNEETIPLKPHTEVPLTKGTTLGNVLHRKDTTYNTLEAIAIFPVIKTGRERAFSDLPVIFAREFALKLEGVAPKTQVYNPVYIVDELRVRGLGHIYDQIMGYYLKAGRPEPKATDYLLKQLSTDGKTVSRVIFVEADLDMNHTTDQSGIFDRLNNWVTDAVPKHTKYFINSRLQVFDAENPNLPLVWGGSWRRSIKTNQFLNLTPSVFSDSDSQQSLAALSRTMSREILWIAPKEAYMAPQSDLSVQGQLAAKKEPPFPNLTETPSGKTRMNETHKQAIQRILQR
jgi:hypothetical protein